MVMNCFLGGPLKSSLVRCSKIHTTAPTKRKNRPIKPHISTVNGFKKAHAFDSLSFVATTIVRPDSMYGCVKSTILVRLVTMDMSPTAASKTYKKKIQCENMFTEITTRKESKHHQMKHVYCESRKYKV